MKREFHCAFFSAGDLSHCTKERREKAHVISMAVIQVLD